MSGLLPCAVVTSIHPCVIWEDSTTTWSLNAFNNRQMEMTVLQSRRAITESTLISGNTPSSRLQIASVLWLEVRIGL